MNVLILEDEKRINEMLTRYISQEGYEVLSADNAEDALEMF